MKKNYTFYLEQQLVDEIRKLAKREKRSLNNFIEVILIEKVRSAGSGGKKNKENAT